MTHLSDPLTPARLSEIRARAEAATPGPWASQDLGGPQWSITPFAMTDEFDNLGGIDRGTDAEFIAAARQDVPDLLAEVDRLTAALDVADKAPHEEDCTSNWFPSCTCWKSEYEATKEALS